MILSDEAYVLLRHPLTESSWIVSFFTREGGSVRAVAKGARKAKSPFRGALEPMNRIQVRITLREGRELGAVTQAELLEGALDLFGRWPHAGVLMAVSETLERGLAQHSAEEETYRLVGAVLKGMRAGADPALAWTYFATWFLRLHGVFPRPDLCSLCGAPPRPLRFDPASGGWLCPSCGSGPGRSARPLSRSAEETLDAVFASPLEALAGRPCPAAGVAALGTLLDHVLAVYLGRPLASGTRFEE